MNLVVARTLSLEDSGAFFLSFAFITFTGMICTLGLNNAVVKYLGIHTDDQAYGKIKGIVNVSVIAVLSVAVLTSSLIIIFRDVVVFDLFDKPILLDLIPYMALSIPFYALYMLFGFVFQGTHNASASTFIQSISTPFIFTAILVSLYCGYQSLSLKTSIQVLTCSYFSSLLVALFVWRRSPTNKGELNYQGLSELYESAKPFWLILIMQQTLLWAGQLIAGGMLPIQDVALLSVSQRISALVSFVLIAVNMVAAPKFAAIAKKGNLDELRRVSKFCSRLMLVVSVPILLIMILFSDFILSIFGEQYLAAGSILIVLLLGQFINVWSGSVAYLLNMAGYENDMRNIVLVTGIITLLLMFLLTSHYGVLGTALATAIGLCIQNLLAVIFVKLRLGFNTLNIF